jgi:hypothetical protein
MIVVIIRNLRNGVTIILISIIVRMNVEELVEYFSMILINQIKNHVLVLLNLVQIQSSHRISHWFEQIINKHILPKNATGNY